MRDGKILVKDFQYMDNNIRVPLEHFAGYKDGVLYVIDHDGKVAGQREMPGMDDITFLGDGFFVVSMIGIKGRYHNGVFDTELNEIIPAEAYEYIYRAERWDEQTDKTTRYDLLLCSRYSDTGDVMFTDVRDLSGNMLIEGLNEIYASGPDRLAVRKGFEAGLMDWSGNWIVRRSIFSGFQD
jgi:hypothetical protein